MMEMARNREEWGDIQNKIVAQVFDSVVAGGLNHMIEGAARSVRSRFAARCIKFTMNIYFYATTRCTVNFYDKTILHFTHESLQVPTLFFSCKNDPMARYEYIDEVISIWRDRSNSEAGEPWQVSEKCWESSIHAGHLKAHPEEYTDILHKFLSKVGESRDIFSKL